MDVTELSTLLKMVEIAVNGEINPTFEYYVFHARSQEEDKSIDDFVRALRELIKTCDICQCDYGMRDKLLQYQIVYGIQDTTLREKLLWCHAT